MSPYVVVSSRLHTSLATYINHYAAKKGKCSITIEMKTGNGGRIYSIKKNKK